MYKNVKQKYMKSVSVTSKNLTVTSDKVTHTYKKNLDGNDNMMSYKMS